MLYHAATEDGSQETTGLPQKSYDESVGQFSQAQLEYFKKWDTLTNFEAVAQRSCQNEIWLLSGENREKVGRCISNLKLVQCSKLFKVHLIGYFFNPFYR